MQAGRYRVRALLQMGVLSAAGLASLHLSAAGQNQAPVNAEAGKQDPAKADAEKPDGAKAEAAKSFRAARASIVQQLRDKNAEVRAAAIQKCAGYPGVDAAKVLMLQGLASSYEDVRHGCIVTLWQFSSTREVADYLRAEVTKDVRKGPVHFATVAAIAVLLAGETDEAAIPAEQSLDKLVALADGPLAAVTLVDELSLHSDEASLKLLLKLSQTQFFRKKFGPRRAMGQALMKMQKAEAVEAILQMLRTVQGETRADIELYFTELCGQRLKTDEAWLAWWKSVRETFEFPKAAGAMQAMAATTPTYYGLPMYGTKIVFIIDASGSMRGERILAAKRELIQAIYDLPDGTEFNVLAFGDHVLPWQRQLLVASKETKPAAQQFVRNLGLASHTASYDALEAAMGFEAEAIFFLTDGKPNAGKISQPPQIVNVISKLNRVKRMTINSIGIGVGLPGNEFDLFLNVLAVENFGKYRRVDE